jgi:hypothetical protein
VNIFLGQLELEIEPVFSRQSDIQDETARHVRSLRLQEVVSRAEQTAVQADRAHQPAKGVEDRSVIVNHEHDGIRFTHETPRIVGKVN